MSYSNTELKLNRLSLCNFRKFESYEIDFDAHLTVLVGDNGSGKSTIIDAASIALGSLFQKLENATAPSISTDDARRIFVAQGDMADAQSQFPVVIGASGIAHDDEIQWSRALNSAKARMTRADASNIISVGEYYQKRVSDGDGDLVLPILARYGTDRLWKQEAKLPDALPSRTQGYAEALHASSNASRMNAWFRKQSIWEWQNKRESDLFNAVKRALASCFGVAASASDAMIDFDAELQQLVFTYHDSNGAYRRDGLRSMSDGYRSTLSLIADIAYRMAILNPAMGEDVLRTPGIVLIDEIDLHLHPRWQARILEDLIRIFPNVQLITTTHSPLVVASVPKSNILMLGESSAVTPSTETKGRDASDVLITVLGASSSSESAAELFNAFNSAIDEDDYAGAKGVLRAIEELVGADDPDVIAAKTTLELEELLA